LAKSSQVRIGPEQRFLHCIFGILLVTDKGKNPSLGSPSVPPAELSKCLVVTRLSRLYKIIIRAQYNRERLIIAAARRY